MKTYVYKVKINEERLPYMVAVRSVHCEWKISDSEKAYLLMQEAFDIDYLAEEYVFMIALDTKNNPLGCFEISHGDINTSILSPREVFQRALLCGAASIILAHNHPSGCTEPSPEDINATKRIRRVGTEMNVELLDHIICGRDMFLSLRDQGGASWEIEA